VVDPLALANQSVCAAQQLARLCEKSDRWGSVPLRLRGVSVKWVQLIF